MLIGRALKSSRNPSLISRARIFSSTAAGAGHQPESDGQPSSSAFSFDKDKEDAIHVKAPNCRQNLESSSSVAMPMSFMTGSVVGKRFYQSRRWKCMDSDARLQNPKNPFKKASQVAIAGSRYGHCS